MSRSCCKDLDDDEVVVFLNIEESETAPPPKIRDQDIVVVTKHPVAEESYPSLDLQNTICFNPDGLETEEVGFIEEIQPLSQEPRDGDVGKFLSWCYPHPRLNRGSIIGLSGLRMVFSVARTEKQRLLLEDFPTIRSCARMECTVNSPLKRAYTP